MLIITHATRGLNNLQKTLKKRLVNLSNLLMTRNDENENCYKVMNAAFVKTQGDLITFSNDDVVIYYTNAISKITSYLNNNNGITIYQFNSLLPSDERLALLITRNLTLTLKIFEGIIAPFLKIQQSKLIPGKQVETFCPIYAASPIKLSKASSSRQKRHALDDQLLLRLVAAEGIMCLNCNTKNNHIEG